MKAGWLKENMLFVATKVQMILILLIFAIFSYHYYDSRVIFLGGSDYVYPDLKKFVSELIFIFLVCCNSVFFLAFVLIFRAKFIYHSLIQRVILAYSFISTYGAAAIISIILLLNHRL